MILNLSDTLYAYEKLKEAYGSLNRIDDYFRMKKIDRIKLIPPTLFGFTHEEELFQDFTIHPNDMNFKIKHAREFLEKGFHVKFRVFLRGREMATPQAGKDVLLRVWPMVEDIGVMEKPPKFEGRYYNMYITPQK